MPTQASNHLDLRLAFKRKALRRAQFKIITGNNRRYWKAQEAHLKADIATLTRSLEQANQEPAPAAIPMTQTSGGRPSIDMRQTRWPWWENAIRVNPLHWRNAIMDDLKFTSFCPPFIADDQAFEDSAAQLANRAASAAPVASSLHALNDTKGAAQDHA